MIKLILNLVWGILMFSMILIRFLDILISILILILIFPFFIILVFFLLFIQGGPIFFISKRVGIRGSEFNILKLRTMKLKTYDSENDSITLIGKYLRRASLDEIPQLINVLKNDMSIVGPRPLPLKIENNIDQSLIEIRRSVKPGITGYAQILYKKEKRSWDEKIQLDISFIENFSITNYLYILLLTFPVLIKRFIFNSKADSL